MRIKICGIRSKEDLKIAVDAGADAIGFLVGQLHASSDFIIPSTAARFAAELPPYVCPVLVTHLIDSDSIAGIVGKTGISTVQLHGGSSLEEVKKLRSRLPLNSKLILAIHIMMGNPVPDYEAFYPFIDAILLDSYNKTNGQVGMTGKIHDWKKSAEIVKKCKLPVILAGGLSPANVVDAINTVRPYGVDANNGLKNSEGGRSPELCRNFVVNARNAANAIESSDEK